jgi:hypothetical protein
MILAASNIADQLYPSLIINVENALRCHVSRQEQTYVVQ